MDIQKDVSLKNHATFKIGGPAKFFCEVKTLDELKEALLWANKNKQRIFILGGGSNVLFMDKGFDGLVIKLRNDAVEIVDESNGIVTVRCESGAMLSDLVRFSVKNELTGLEWAAGIPGMVGGALRGNAGAFTGEIRDCVKSVRALKSGEGAKLHQTQLCEFDNKKCEFEYRSSVFKKSDGNIVWDCVLELRKGDAELSKQEVQDYIKRRKAKQPPLDEYPSAGSIFKNPVANEKLQKQFEEDKNVRCRANKIPAGWLIEQCDLKEKKIGNAMVSPKQANFVVNMGEATAEDVLILLSLIKMKVRNQHNVQLEEEMQIVM